MQCHRSPGKGVNWPKVQTQNGNAADDLARAVTTACPEVKVRVIPLKPRGLNFDHAKTPLPIPARREPIWLYTLRMIGGLILALSLGLLFVTLLFLCGR
jgi:hypothetical protein